MGWFIGVLCMLLLGFMWWAYFVVLRDEGTWLLIPWAIFSLALIGEGAHAFGVG